MSRLVAILFSLFPAFASAADTQDLSHVFVNGAPPTPDARFHPPRRVTEGNNFRPWSDGRAWETRVRQLHEQALVAAGLWPMPEKCPLNSTVTSTVDCGDYTVENLYFSSYPGFYVTGSLFRPKGAGPFPAVLNAHGHAKLGRLEKGTGTGRDGKPLSDPFPYQKRGAGFARLGCIAFLYDMVGYAESRQIKHPTDSPKTRVPEGTDDFEGLEFEMNCLSTLGLQTWDSIRAVDYLLSRSDVDPKRIAITGASGGATQTLLLMMTDDRLAAAAPVCMVSTGFQGDCTCEQCALLKIGTDTVEYCAAFAPKPLIVVGATGDWTKEIIEKGGPEIRAAYDSAGAGEHLNIVRFEAPHNYNRRSREAVYEWLNREWKLGHASPVQEQPLTPLSAEQLSVFNEKHPRPANALGRGELKRMLVESSRKQIDALRPTDAGKLAEFRHIVGTALTHMVASELPKSAEVRGDSLGFVERKTFKAERLVLSRTGGGEQIPAMLFVPKNANGNAVLLVHPMGKAGLIDAAGEPGALLTGLLDKGEMVLAIDAFLTGESKPDSRGAAPDPHIGFFPCFNRTLLAQRVHDILTAVGYLHARAGVTRVSMVGLGEAGPWCLLARGICRSTIARAAIEVGDFRFANVKDVADPMYLPGAMKYGDLPVLVALSAPGELLLSNARGFDAGWVKDAYRACGADAGLHIMNSGATAANLIDWVVRTR